MRGLKIKGTEVVQYNFWGEGGVVKYNKWDNFSSADRILRGGGGGGGGGREPKHHSPTKNQWIYVHM